MNTKQLVSTALLVSMVCIATMTISIPIANGGYVNIGDGLIYLIGVIFKNPYSYIAAGIGSFFADLFLGYPTYMFYTLIIKGLMGFVIGRFSVTDKPFCFKTLISIFFAALIMVIGYFFVDVIHAYFITGLSFNKSVIVGLPGILSNLMQSFIGLILYIFFHSLFTIIKKKYKRY